MFSCVNVCNYVKKPTRSPNHYPNSGRKAENCLKVLQGVFRSISDHFFPWGVRLPCVLQTIPPDTPQDYKQGRAVQVPPNAFFCRRRNPKKADGSAFDGAWLGQLTSYQLFRVWLIFNLYHKPMQHQGLTGLFHKVIPGIRG